jgi:hypothetical protein
MKDAPMVKRQVKAGDRVFLVEHTEHGIDPHDIGEIVEVDHAGKEVLVRWGTGVLGHHSTPTLKLYRNSKNHRGG